MAAEVVKNRQRTPKRYLAEQDSDEEFVKVDAIRKDSKLSRKSKSRKESAPPLQPAAFTSTQSELPAGAAGRKERLARRALEESQFQQELEKALRLSAQKSGPVLDEEKAEVEDLNDKDERLEDRKRGLEEEEEEASDPEGGQDLPARLADLHRKPVDVQRPSSSSSIEFDSVETVGSVSSTALTPNSASAAGKKRKIDESWIVNSKKEAERLTDGPTKTDQKMGDQELEDDDDEVVVGRKRTKRPAVLVDSDSEEEDLNERKEKSTMVKSMSQASTQSPPRSPAKLVRKPPGRSKSSGKENRVEESTSSSSESETEDEEEEEEDEEEFVPRPKKGAAAAKAKGRPKSAKATVQAGKKAAATLTAKPLAAAVTNVKVGGDRTADLPAGLVPLVAPALPRSLRAAVAACSVPSSVRPAEHSAPASSSVRLAMSPSVSACPPALSPVPSRPPLQSPGISQVKIPAWTPPARLPGRGDLGKGFASSPTTLISPSIGLRVGLSRNIKVSKPLHSSVKHVP